MNVTFAATAGSEVIFDVGVAFAGQGSAAEIGVQHNTGGIDNAPKRGGFPVREALPDALRNIARVDFRSGGELPADLIEDGPNFRDQEFVGKTRGDVVQCDQQFVYGGKFGEFHRMHRGGKLEFIPWPT